MAWLLNANVILMVLNIGCAIGNALIGHRGLAVFNTGVSVMCLSAVWLLWRVR